MNLILKSLAVFLWLLVAALVLLLLASQFPFVTANREIAGALLGAVGTIFAGWLAWMAVERQLGAAEVQRVKDSADRTITLAADLITISYQILTDVAETDPLVASARSRIEALDTVSVILASSVRTALHEADRINLLKAHIRENPGDASSRAKRALEMQRPGSAFRLRLLADAVGQASDNIRNGRPVRDSLVITREAAEEMASDCRTTLDSAAYTRSLVKDI